MPDEGVVAVGMIDDVIVGVRKSWSPEHLRAVGVAADVVGSVLAQGWHRPGWRVASRLRLGRGTERTDVEADMNATRTTGVIARVATVDFDG